MIHFAHPEAFLLAIGIALWLAVVVAVNIGFVVVAVSDADPIASSYEAGER